MSAPSGRPPLDPALERLIEAERRRPLPSGPRLDRVYERVCSTVAPPGGPADAPAEDPGAAAEQGAGRGHALPPTVKLVGAVVLVGALLAGIGHQVLRRGDSPSELAASPRPTPPRPAPPPSESAAPPARSVPPLRGAAPSSRPVATLPALPPQALEPPGARQPRRTTRRLPPRPAGPRHEGLLSRPVAPLADELAAERRLLDTARAALSAGRSTDALETVAAHRRRFPLGRLVEEREALSVLALVREGRADEARAAGTLFLGRYPKSIMAGVVRDALSALPAEPGP